MTTVQIIDGDFNIADPGWPKYSFDRVGAVLISDDFTINGFLGGQATDSALGGQAVTWQNAQYVSEAWVVNGGQAVWNKTGTVLLPLTQQNYDLEVKIDSLPTAPTDTISIQARRQSGSSYYVAAVVRGNGSLSIKHFNGVSTAETTVVPNLVTSGDVVTLRVIGGAASVLINDAVAMTEVVSVWEGSFAGLNSASAAGARLGHVKIIAR